MSETIPDREPALWCNWCRREGVRRLSEAERTWLGDLRARHARRVWLGAIVTPVAITVGISIAPLLSEKDHEALRMALALTLGIAGFVALPASMLLVRDHVRAWQSLTRDLAGGDAWCFAPPEPGFEPTGKQLAPFALLPHFRRVVDPTDRRLLPLTADVIETDSGEVPRYYAPLSLVVVRGPSGPPLEQRSLNQAERGELRRLARTLPAPRLDTVFAALGLLGLAMLFTLGRNTGARDASSNGWFGAVFWSLVCVRHLVRQGRSMRLAQRVRRDLEAGLVVHAASSVADGREFLPFSQLSWRLGPAPVPWRDRRTAVHRLRAGL